LDRAYRLGRCQGSRGWRSSCGPGRPPRAVSGKPAPPPSPCGHCRPPRTISGTLDRRDAPRSPAPPPPCARTSLPTRPCPPRRRRPRLWPGLPWVEVHGPLSRRGGGGGVHPVAPITYTPPLRGGVAQMTCTAGATEVCHDRATTEVCHDRATTEVTPRTMAHLRPWHTSDHGTPRTMAHLGPWHTSGRDPARVSTRPGVSPVATHCRMRRHASSSRCIPPPLGRGSRVDDGCIARHHPACVHTRRPRPPGQGATTPQEKMHVRICPSTPGGRRPG